MQTMDKKIFQVIPENSLETDSDELAKSLISVNQSTFKTKIEVPENSPDEFNPTANRLGNLPTQKLGLIRRVSMFSEFTDADASEALTLSLDEEKDQHT